MKHSSCPVPAASEQRKRYRKRYRSTTSFRVRRQLRRCDIGYDELLDGGWPECTERDPGVRLAPLDLTERGNNQRLDDPQTTAPRSAVGVDRLARHDARQYRRQTLGARVAHSRPHIELDALVLLEPLLRLSPAEVQ